MTATRRLAAILAADVVGYSRLMGEDEAGTARAVREHREAARPIVAGFGGRIVKTTGDGLLVEFPSVVAAVECAIAIQNLMVERNAETSDAKKIVYRIGVNLGDVLIEGDDILGDGVNIAARLEGLCEPGGVLVSGAAYEHTRGRIDAVFVDLGEKDLKNIARPVRVYALRVRQDAALISIPAAVNRQGPLRLSIVVLPFANIGGGPEEEHFVDGVTESLTTDLSRIRGSFVIGRNTAFTYKGKPVDLKQISRELNVRYVLEGSVQRGGNRMRVNVQLIDAETGNHLWAERFDKPLGDLFDMQDEIVARLANAEMLNQRELLLEEVDVLLLVGGELFKQHTRHPIAGLLADVLRPPEDTEEDVLAARSHSRISLTFCPILSASSDCMLGRPSRNRMRATSWSACCISSIDSLRQVLASSL